jgi:chaperonin cofactor prefoldin
MPIALCIILLIISIGGNLWLWTSLNQANSEITSLETTVSTKNSEIEALESEVSSLQADKNNLQSQVSSLETENNQLQTWLYDNKSQISSLKASVLGLEDEIESLNAENSRLKQDCFMYYTVGDSINISNLGSTEKEELFDELCFDLNGTITNIGDKPIETVYVYLIIRNPDDTADFRLYWRDEIENLYIGESATFEFTYISYDESWGITPIVEIFVIY